MEDKKFDENGVEIVPAPAPAGEGIKDKAVDVPPTKDEPLDYEKMFYDLLDENSKVVADRDNYKAGLLKAKGKDNPQDPDDSSKLDGVAKQIGSLQDLVKVVLKENKEIKTALANRSQVPNAGTGSSGEDKKPTKEGFWTEEQVAYFKKKNIDPNKVKDNYLISKSDK